MAPTTPFFAEYLFQAVREGEDEESVHLATWPEARATANFIQRILGRGKEGEQLLAAMSFARSAVTNALMQRSEAGIKVRQPLAKLTIKYSGSALPFWQYIAPVIADEVNVKEVELGNIDQLTVDITPELLEEGIVRGFIHSAQEARKEAKLTPRDKVKVSYGSAVDDAIIQKYKKQILEATNATELTHGSGEGIVVEKT